MSVIEKIINFLFKTQNRTQRIDTGDIDISHLNIFKYGSDDKFDYSKYKMIQISTNYKKINKTSIDERDIKQLSIWIKDNITPLRFGLCHGTRRGLEQIYFRKYTHAKVFGTDISPTANSFPFTIQHDFHDIKDSWIDHFDFIFSNSYDHSYNLEICIKQWMKCLRKGGYCILEHCDNHLCMKASDPTGIDKNTLIKLINYWGKGAYYCKDSLQMQDYVDNIHPDCLRGKNLSYIMVLKCI